MRLAKTLMVQGTASTVGKSTLVAGLCRLFAQDGWRVAPFKAQNMALNSWVTRDGGEMGRAQVVQAEAAGIEPRVEMNPILLKPEGASRSQVIVLGRPMEALEAQQYYQQRGSLWPVVQQSLARLREEYDLILIEGAGSPVELNLARYDLVNMRVAQEVQAPVLLVGDIDRGGIFAALLGTLMLLEPEQRALVKGLIVNKFRGDLALWRDGERLLAERAAVPVVGTVPFFTDIRIAEEDVVPLDEGSILRSSGSAHDLEIAVVKLPFLSNYDEFDALAAEPRVRLRFICAPEELVQAPDLLILPGTKNTIADLHWLWQQGLAQWIIQYARNGGAIFGICGGYQMLGRHVSDPGGVEALAGTREKGLQLLPIETTLGKLSEKITTRCRARIVSQAARGIFQYLSEETIEGYQIHVGRSSLTEDQYKGNGSALLLLADGGTEEDGWVSSDGWCGGCYLHGLFEQDRFRQGVLKALAERRYGKDSSLEFGTFSCQREYDKLANLLRASLDIASLKQLCGLTEMVR